MKRILRLDEDDITGIIMEYYDVRPSQITSTYIDVEDETKFFVEIEENE